MQKEELLQTVFDTIPHFVMIKNLDGTYRKVNKAFADSYGKNTTDFKGVHPYDMGLDRDEVAHFLAMDREVIRTRDKIVSGEYTITYPNGRVTIQRSVRLPLKDKNGLVIGIVVDVEDITEIKKLQRQMCLNMKKELVGDLTTNIANEFNNILQIIKSDIENIRDGKTPTNSFETIFSQINRGADAIYQLIKFKDNENIKIEII